MSNCLFKLNKEQLVCKIEVVGSSLVQLNFIPFEDIYRNLINLTEFSNLTTRVDDEINKLLQNEPSMTEKSALNQIILAEMSKLFDRKDDFEEMFENSLVKIFLLIYFFIFMLILNTIFNVLLVHYEKFGGDPMKRSLQNQLIAQFGYAQILFNLVLAPVWIFRILIGPVHLSVVDICATVFQSVWTW